MKVAFLAKGYHPPWCEGGRNVLRGWSFVFSKIPSFNFEVYSFVDLGNIRESYIRQAIGAHATNR